MAHHSDRPLSDELKKLFEGDVGPTNSYPQGKLNADDAGEIQISIAADKKNGKVLMDFGVPTQWIGFDYQQACSLAMLIIEKAHSLRGIK